MRILVINGSTDLYGANRILSFVLNNFPLNAKVELLLPSLEGPFIGFLKQENPSITVTECKQLPIIQRSMFSLKGIWQAIALTSNFFHYLKKENGKEKIDLIYVNTLSNFLCIGVVHRLGIKSIVHVHEMLEKPRFISKIINKYSVKWADRILAVSEAVKQNLLGDIPASMEGKVTVIRNGIPDLYLNTSKGTSGKCIITLIGRIKPDKGIGYFLDALKRIQDKPNVFVRIVGGHAPGGEDYVIQLKKDLKSIHFDNEYIPFTNDVRRYLNETDILVVPSIMKDPFPTTVLEGLSAGKAVIATNTGGAPEAIVHEKSGFLINIDDPETFAQTLSRLINDKNLRNKIGQEARKHYLNHFSLETFNKKMQGFLKQELNI